MTNMKKIISAGTAVLLVGAISISAVAASLYTTPAEAAAGVTGKTVEVVTAEKQASGKTYGTIANDAGKLEEFKTEMLELKKATLAKRVADGTLTQEKAEEILTSIEENQATCDGTGSASIGKKNGVGFGKSDGTGTGNGMKRGGGQGNGQGNGNRNGTCLVK